MGTPPIPHFGTTLYEEAPPEGTDQAAIPFTGMLARTDRFLTLLGAECFIQNFYGPLGRQYIYRRGKIGDVDYFEKDSFTSYSARFAPAASGPRIADTIFRVVHRDARSVYRQMLAEDLVRPIGPDGDERQFLDRATRSLLVMGPDDQRYELSETAETVLENHAVFIWTDPARLPDTVRQYAVQMDLVDRFGAKLDFHGIGEATVLTRLSNPITVGLLTPYPGERLSPRWTDDIFKQVGYSHFRLASPRKEYVVAHNQQVFPDTGDVSYVLFNEAYLELIQLEEARVPVGA
ncbi:MAG: hypothetical protein ACKVT1_16430 [Dehalococcoidia bacterium]